MLLTPLWRSNQSILKEISPGCSLEGLMLKLKLQYFGHLMWKVDSLEKTFDAGKVLHSICQQIWKTQQWPQDWKMSVFIPVPKKGNAKECSYYRTFALISHASKVMLKILQARLQQYVNRELPDVQAGFRKRRGTRGTKLPTSTGSSKKQESSRKTSISALLTMPKPLCGSQ